MGKVIITDELVHKIIEEAKKEIEKQKKKKNIEVIRTVKPVEIKETKKQRKN